MSANSFPSSNDTFLDSFTFLKKMYCFINEPYSFIFLVNSVINTVTTLPVMIYILYQGVKHWKQSLPAKMSHSDVFTYHMAVIELIGILGYILVLSVLIGNKEDLKTFFVGTLACFFTWYGQTFFHVLTCLERYLAVVHPITYLKLKNKREIRTRNITIGCVWLILFVFMSLILTKTFTITDFCFFSFSLLFIFFCTISVLRVLIRPAPGDQVGVREKIDQSKQRAFYTMVAILGAQVVRYIGSFIWKLVFASLLSNECLMMASVSWTFLPSSLVLPLLFLNRAGKLVCCKNCF